MSANRLKARRSRPHWRSLKSIPTARPPRLPRAPKRNETEFERLQHSSRRNRRLSGLCGPLFGRYRVGQAFGAQLPLGNADHQRDGSFLIGLFIGLFALRWNLSEPVRVFLTVGICGGYTTFSTFSLDAFYLWERGEVWATAAYMLGSVFLSIAGTFAGIYLVRAVS
jgi:fluoride exporter